MPLRFDLSEVENPEELWVPASPTQSEHLIGTAEALVQHASDIGIAHITARNMSEVLYRMQQVENLLGPLVYDDKGPVMFAEDHIRRLIGMKISVVPKKNEKFDRDLKQWQKDAEKK